ncbi:hypothetical protein F4778DRAFT_639028 [Xylariomycetidae sp. FL2044]|nr:hypothetical protein F4778DRAFT_639028 [Xylariomycetidae sp. FL2044]
MEHPDADGEVQVLRVENSPADKQLSEARKLSVTLTPNDGDAESSIRIGHGGNPNALTISLQRTTRVRESKNINSLIHHLPGLGTFHLTKVQHYADTLPEESVKKGGVFFSMAKREAMKINLSAREPFAIKVFVGGVNAFSGLSRVENEQTRQKRCQMALIRGRLVQDYLADPVDELLDGIICEDGRISQFVAAAEGSGFCVGAEVTGEDVVGDMQIEIIPIKHAFPTKIDVRYQSPVGYVFKHTIDLAGKDVTENSTWRRVKELVHEEFRVDIDNQDLRPYPFRPSLARDIEREAKLGDFPLEAGLSLTLTHKNDEADSRVHAPIEEGDQDHKSGYQIKEDLYPKRHWDIEASILLNIQVLSPTTFRQVTGRDPPPIPSAYKEKHAYLFMFTQGNQDGGAPSQFHETRWRGGGGCGGVRRQGDELLDRGRFASTFRSLDELEEELRDEVGRLGEP